MSEKITVFDIEVLNQDPASVCAIGIVQIQDLQVVSTYYSLIKPKNLSFDPYRFRVHQIRPQSLYKEKAFPEVWKDIHHYFENTIVVSHDIQGDMMNLRAALKQYHMTYPRLMMSCTNVLAHLVYPKLSKYNLKDLSIMNGFQFQAHHALEDAKACAYLLMQMLEQEDVSSLYDLHQKFHLEFGEMKENYYRNIISAESVVQLLEMNQREDALLYHQSVCFTGKLYMPREVLEEKTKEACALSTNQVSTHTNYLVIGGIGYHKVRFGKENKKVKKALHLMKQGQDLRIIHEKEYLKLLEGRKECL